MLLEISVSGDLRIPLNVAVVGLAQVGLLREKNGQTWKNRRILQSHLLSHLTEVFRYCLTFFFPSHDSKHFIFHTHPYIS